MKKILLVAYSFPPVAANRSRRAIKLAQYLPVFSWQPYVLTVKNPDVFEYDYSLVEKISSEIPVIRTPSLNLSFARRKAKGKNDNKYFGFLRKLKACIFYPDTRITWLPSAFMKGLRLIKKEKIQVIMAIGEPFSSFLTGVLLKTITGKPLLIDFRDEWVALNSFRYPKREGLLDKIDRIVEKIIIKKADIVTVTTEGIRKNFIDRYPEHRDKFYCLPNGFDRNDFLSFEKNNNRKQKLTITYCGSVYKGRTIRFFLQALEEILQEHAELINNIKFIFMGTKDKAESAFFSRPLLKKVVADYGFVSHRTVLEKMVQSDLLLCLEENSPEIANRYIPGKIYEYLASNTPILGLVAHSGEIATLIKKTSAGIIIDAKDTKKIRTFLLNAVEKIRSKGALDFSPKKEIIESFSYANSVKNLTSLLCEVTKEI